MLTHTEIEKWKTQHIPYRLGMLDDLRWWCEFRTSGRNHENITLTVNGQRICASALTNGVTESGLMACRFLLEFLGLKPKRDSSSPTGYDLAPILDNDRQSDDVWAERIGCKSCQPDDFAPDERHACGYTHKLASRGVGHPTAGPGGVELTWLTQGANVIERGIVDRVYLGNGPAIRSPLWFVALPDRN